MSNYTQSTNFATKDALTSGDPLKIVKGTEINTEFVNISVAIATKADLASPTFTGVPAAPTASPATNSTQIATTAYIDAAITAVKTALFPVGSIYTNATVSTNPGTLLGFGTWTAFGAGRVPVGFDAGNVLFDTAEETGGSADSTLPSHTHTATVTDPGHAHTLNLRGGASGNSDHDIDSNLMASRVRTVQSSADNPSNSATTDISVTNASAGTSGTNANYQPYITVYLWKRTA